MKDKEFKVVVPDRKYYEKALQDVSRKLNCSPKDIHFVRATGALVESSRRMVRDLSWCLFLTSPNSGKVILRKHKDTGIPVIPVTRKELEEMDGLAFLAK